MYLIKLILILVFNICVNTYYINLGCNCSCKPNKNNSAGGKHGDIFAIDLDEHTLKCNENILQGFKKIDDPLNYNVKNVIHGDFKNDEDIYYTIDENIFNSIKEDSNVEIIKTSDSDNYIVFAVKTQVNGLGEVNPKYDYYIVYCHSGNTKVNNNGLFDSINTNVEIKILGSGNNLTNTSYMFYCCKNLTKITFTIKGLNTSNVNTMEGMFNGCEKLEKLNLSTFGTSKVTNMQDMFYGCDSLTSLNVSNFNTSNVKNMKRMFYRCSSLKELNLYNFNTVNVTSMEEMFCGCNRLTYLNVSNFDTSKVENMGGMFFCCNSLTSLNLSNFNTNKVTYMGGMFNGCNSLTSLNLSNFDTSKVENMGGMFDRCDNLKGKVTTNDERIKSDYAQFIR